MRLTIHIVWALALLNTAYTKVVSNFEDLHKKDYDFIVVGGGTAGLVVANRLTENPDWSVLVIEAGDTDEGKFEISVPFFTTRLAQTQFDWNFTSVPQRNLSGRVTNLPRGFLLGGSSSINDMGYGRGTSEDYDHYAAVTGDAGWSWNNMIPYFFKNEKLELPSSRRHIKNAILPILHGHHGINVDSLPGLKTPLDDRVIETTRELSHEFPYNEDVNSGYQLGVGWLPRTINNGTRGTSATSYLAPKFRSRPNLDVLVNTRVTRILENGITQQGQPPAMRTVEFADSPEGERYRLTAAKEVILSGGAVGSPHILQHSGIGDSEHLTSLGIKTVLHNPSVGQNMSNQLGFLVDFTVNTTDTYDDVFRNATVEEEELRLWNETHTGQLAETITTQLGFFRVPDESPVWNVYPDPASGPNTAHYEFLFCNGLLGHAPPTGYFMSMLIVLAAPSSRGTITLNSSNPFDTPVIDPNYLGSELDLFISRQAFRAARRFTEAKAWSGYLLSSFSPNATTDDELDDYIRENARPGEQVCGTAAMSPKGADYGVVDPDLKVKGVTGLRVVDVSVFPKMPSGHTQVPVYVFAERVSDLIKESWAREKLGS